MQLHLFILFHHIYSYLAGRVKQPSVCSMIQSMFPGMNLQRRAKTRLGGTVALPKIRCMGIRWHMNDAQWCRVVSLESILRADVANSVLTLPTHVRKITLSLAPIQICALVCRHLCAGLRGEWHGCRITPGSQHPGSVIWCCQNGLRKFFSISTRCKHWRTDVSPFCTCCCLLFSSIIKS